MQGENQEAHLNVLRETLRAAQESLLKLVTSFTMLYNVQSSGVTAAEDIARHDAVLQRTELEAIAGLHEDLRKLFPVSHTELQPRLQALQAMVEDFSERAVSRALGSPPRRGGRAAHIAGPQRAEGVADSWGLWASGSFADGLTAEEPMLSQRSGRGGRPGSPQRGASAAGQGRRTESPSSPSRQRTGGGSGDASSPARPQTSPAARDRDAWGGGPPALAVGRVMFDGAEQHDGIEDDAERQQDEVNKARTTSGSSTVSSPSRP